MPITMAGITILVNIIIIGLPTISIDTKANGEHTIRAAGKKIQNLMHVFFVFVIL